MRDVTDILLDTSKIEDKKTSDTVEGIINQVRHIYTIMSSEYNPSKLLKLINSRYSLISTINPRLNSASRIEDLSFLAILEIIRAEVLGMSAVFNTNISKQYLRYNRSVKKIRKKFKIYPSAIYKVEIEHDLGSKIQQVLSRINLEPQSLWQNMASWTSLSDAITDYIKVYRKHMIDVWKNIQEIEKYRNDNGRFWIARIALCVSVIWILVGQSANVVNNMQRLAYYVEIWFTSNKVLSPSDLYGRHGIKLHERLSPTSNQ